MIWKILGIIGLVLLAILVLAVVFCIGLVALPAALAYTIEKDKLTPEEFAAKFCDKTADPTFVKAVPYLEALCKQSRKQTATIEKKKTTKKRLVENTKKK